MDLEESSNNKLYELEGRISPGSSMKYGDYNMVLVLIDDMGHVVEGVS